LRHSSLAKRGWKVPLVIADPSVAAGRRHIESQLRTAIAAMGGDRADRFQASHGSVKRDVFGSVRPLAIFVAAGLPNIKNLRRRRDGGG